VVDSPEGLNQDVGVEHGYFALRLAPKHGLAQDKISLREILEAGGVAGGLGPS